MSTTNLSHNISPTNTIKFDRPAGFFDMLKKFESGKNVDGWLNEFKQDGQLFIYKISGWHLKDSRLLNKMIKFNKHAVCYGCFSKCNYNSFKLAKTLPYEKMRLKKDNILSVLKKQSTDDELIYYKSELDKIPNILCICDICYNNIRIDNVPKAPNNINHVIEKYNPNLCTLGKLHMDMVSVNRMIAQKIKKLKNNNNHLTRCMNYMTDENNKMTKCVKVEEEKYNKLLKTYNRNTKLMSKYKKKMKEELSEMNIEIEKSISQTYDTYNEYSKEKIDDNSALLCKLCMNNKIDIAISGCGHVYCQSCLDKMVNDYDKAYGNYLNYIHSHDLDINGQYDYKPELKCPECRCDIKKCIKIYI